MLFECFSNAFEMSTNIFSKLVTNSVSCLKTLKCKWNAYKMLSSSKMLLKCEQNVEKHLSQETKKPKMLFKFIANVVKQSISKIKCLLNAFQMENADWMLLKGLSLNHNKTNIFILFVTSSRVLWRHYIRKTPENEHISTRNKIWSIIVREKMKTPLRS